MQRCATPYMATNNIMNRDARPGVSRCRKSGSRIFVGPARKRFIFRTMPTIDLWSLLFVFVLATFVGFQVIQNVSRLLHTPLMSLTNAISAIAVVGSILIAGERESSLTTILGTVAVAASMTNIVSGFLITDRMLKMFREKGAK
jgi:proton-translocating NAD(P)+ transhydrogenase subunit alpha